MVAEYIKTIISGLKTWVSAELNKTRTHWTDQKLVYLIDNKELTFQDRDSGVYMCEYPSNVFADVLSGDQLYVIFDDIEYECICETYNESVSCGDISIIENGVSGPDTPPFFIVFFPTGALIATCSDGQTHRISISMTQEIVHKLDVKYLPEIFAKRSDLDTIKATLKNKVDKVSGKGLSTNDYTTTEKNKLAGIATGANKTVVDSSLSTTSTNPVQNGVITKELNKKMTSSNPIFTGTFSLNRKSETTVGSYSFTEGYNTTASGYAAHAEGSSTTASGNSTHAEGYKTYATAPYSHAEGDSTTASEANSHAEGSSTTASGANSHAEGIVTTASGSSSHAEGASTTASGEDSHAEGYQSIASGKWSHAECYAAKAFKIASHAEGFSTTANSDYQHVQGKYNIVDTDGKYAHIVGNGSSDAKSNAHTLDWSGNAWYAGTVEGTAMIVKSSTVGSSKRFKITVDDSGTISVTEVT